MDNEKVVDGLIELRKREKAKQLRREHLKKLLVKKRMRCKSFGYRSGDNDKAIGRLTFPGNLVSLLSTEENSVICPYGIANVLAMVAEGASDESLQEILAVLGYKDMDEFREAVLAVQNEGCEALKSENSLDFKKGEEQLELLDAFKKKMLDAYQASIAEQNSDGLAILELKNVATFKAKWLYKLERDLSHGNLFRNADGSMSRPAYLTCEEDDVGYYYEDGDSYDDEVKAIALPYKLGAEEIPYEMVLVESKYQIDAHELQHIFNNLRRGKCRAEFPEFSIRSEYNLIPMMQKLGLNNIFDEGFPAFDKIATQPLYVKAFAQKAEIEVDKEGTVAKAVTMMATWCLAGSPERKVHMVFRKPFSYFLRNTSTGEIVFMGKVNKLSDCNRQKPILLPMW